jgi:hypothetical protein
MAVAANNGLFRSRRSGTYGLADRAAAARRHLMYLSVRSHLAAGWDTLPEGLSPTDVRDLATMAGSRRDRTMQSVCRRYGLSDGRSFADSRDACPL